MKFVLTFFILISYIIVIHSEDPLTSEKISDNTKEMKLMACINLAKAKVKAEKVK